MSELLIFGGTSEGRELADFCVKNSIPATVSVVSAYGASLLPSGISVLTGRMNAEEMKALLLEGRYASVVDATHPYAAEATRNIQAACSAANVRYLRLVRQPEKITGEIVQDMQALLEILNHTTGTVLSTLGSKSIPDLLQMQNWKERLWVRVLPEYIRFSEIPSEHIIAQKGPFSVEQNVEHIRRSGAGILLTKESGAAGGYPEKAEAAKICGIRFITLTRPDEVGYTLSQIQEMLKKEVLEK